MLERVPHVKATPKPERCVRPAPAADAGRPTVHRDGWQRVGARAPDRAGHASRAAVTPASPGAWRVRPRRARGRDAPSHPRPLNAHTRQSPAARSTTGSPVARSSTCGRPAVPCGSSSIHCGAIRMPASPGRIRTEPGKTSQHPQRSERRAAPAAGTAAARLTRALVWRAPASRDRGFRTVRPRKESSPAKRDEPPTTHHLDALERRAPPPALDSARFTDFVVVPGRPRRAVRHELPEAGQGGDRSPPAADSGLRRHRAYVVDTPDPLGELAVEPPPRL